MPKKVKMRVLGEEGASGGERGTEQASMQASAGTILLMMPGHRFGPTFNGSSARPANWAVACLRPLFRAMSGTVVNL